ncbi:UDP-2,3-diacylglucosamine diphosphatase [uncultured Pseudacidovorax sp.]|uniref:UDP-2,3-diacylglucosamine diphosphatase n=1 Tax=uncultured Pseudacidovorax sp. TaxID=679313 RepID=UPI0025F72063|nr:UDP-2,3-diacylglucosamine diphosphatase [uncultured Pseudacidovorax sp.]
MTAQTAFTEFLAPPQWGTVDLLSDLHLHPGEPETLQAWRSYLQTTPADALFILGDLFEVWVGDDAALEPGFEADCADWLREAAKRRPIFFMAGNRDFLLGQAFAAQAGIQLLPDPLVLVLHGERWLLSHGDLLCLDDADYLAFRAQVRTAAWQDDFLARPLAERRALARHMRTQSESRKADPRAVWADVDAEAAVAWLRSARARTLVHGHTHKPGRHSLGGQLERLVLSDWDVAASPPRAQVLCLTPTGAQRVDLR